jgi:hypothetical protein
MSIDNNELLAAVETLRLCLMPAAVAQSAADAHKASERLGAAQQVFRSALAVMVQGVTSNSEHWEAAVLSVADKFEDQAISGHTVEIRHPKTYFRQALKWRVLDLIRKDEARVKVEDEDRIRRAAELAKEEEKARKAALWPAIDEVYAVVFRLTDLRYRPAVQRAMESLRLIHRENLTLKEALLKVQPALAEATDPDALERAAAALHKSHQRLRQAIITEVEAKIAAGRTPESEGCDIICLVSTLRRRSPNGT